VPVSPPGDRAAAAESVTMATDGRRVTADSSVDSGHIAVGAELARRTVAAASDDGTRHAQLQQPALV